ncbi:MAG: hypothetical protein JXP73_05170 [Deltaproteobacteria bacterium]|nr:hypothetical protein [Deltaproteobacteria bacterium]
MSIPAKSPSIPPPAKAAPAEVNLVSLPKMHRLLAQAAELAASAGLPPDAFAGVAWQEYLRAFPALAEQLAEAQFEAALQRLRDSGRLAKA